MRRHIRNLNLSNRSLLIGLLTVGLLSGSLAAQAPEDKDVTPGGKPAPTTPEKKKKRKSKVKLKVSGVIQSAYEFTDYEVNGAADSVGPTKEKSGFKMNRAYLNFKGKVQEGPIKDWKFRITADIGRASELGDGCANTSGECQEDNDYIYRLKYAFVDIPMFLKGLSLRVGQQHSPMVDAAHGFSLQKNWGHRYLAKTSTEELGLSSSTELGASLIYKSTYFGGSILLANGEGYHKTNGTDIAGTRSNISKGSGGSYAMDMYGMLSVRPTGKNKNLEVTLNLPFRVHAITRPDDTEAEVTTFDISSGLYSPSYTFIYGDKRAKRDLTYGLEGDVIVRKAGFKFGLGGGAMVKKDKRTNAYEIDSTVIGGVTSVSDLVSHVTVDQDAKGMAQYVFAHVRWRYLGAVLRYTVGHEGSSLDGKLDAPSRKGWLMQAAELDAADGTLGNLDYYSLDNGIDKGKGQFENIIFGVTYHGGDRFRVTLGMSLLRGRNTAGKQFRVNPLERVSNSSGTTLASQLESSSEFKNLIGVNSSDSFVANDFIGKKKENRQVFIRSEFKF